MPVCLITFQPLTLVLHSLLYNTVHKFNGWNFEKQPAGLLRAYMLEKRWKQFDRRRSVRTSAETTRDSCQWLVCSGCDRQYVPNIFLLEGHVLLIHVALPHRCAPCGGRRPVTLCYLLITKYSLIEFPKKGAAPMFTAPQKQYLQKNFITGWCNRVASRTNEWTINQVLYWSESLHIYRTQRDALNWRYACRRQPFVRTGASPCRGRGHI